LTISSTLTTDSLIPPEHPIRRIKPVVKAVLAVLGTEFDAMYRAPAAERSSRAVAQGDRFDGLYSIRSERQFCEQLRYDLLFKLSSASTSTTKVLTTARSAATGSGC
jgi:hypothetical protein